MLFTTLLGGAYTLELRMVTNLPNDVRPSLKDARFQIRVSVSSIPSAVQLSFAKARGEGAFAMRARRHVAGDGYHPEATVTSASSPEGCVIGVVLHSVLCRRPRR